MSKREQLKKEEIKHTITIPVTERKNVLCLRLHIATVTVNKKERWNLFTSGAFLIIEKEGEGLRDYSVSMANILEQILILREKNKSL